MAIMTDEPEGGPPPGALLKAVPGRARPRADVLAEFNEWVDAQRKRIKPGLWALFIPRLEDQFRWRVQLDCGCTPEVLTSGRDKFPDGRAYYDPIGQAYLPLGEMWCDTDHEAPTPYRDIVAWEDRTVHEFPADPVEDPYDIGEEVWAKIRHPEPHSAASWRVKLSCGHHGSVSTDLNWKPEDGPTLASEARAQEMLEEFEEYWRGDPDAWPAEGIERDRMRTRIEQRWPRPEPDRDCYTCSRVRRIVGYQRIGSLMPPPKQPKPATMKRSAIEARLKKAEAEAERLRRELEALD